MALFESYERRIDQINAALNKYGIKDIDEAKAICDAKGIDPYKMCEDTQKICFENAKWAYVVGAAIAIKKGVKSAAEAAEAIGEGLQAFCIPGSVADDRKVGLGHGNLSARLLREETECFAFLAGHESYAAAEGAIKIAEMANKVRQKPSASSLTDSERTLPRSSAASTVSPMCRPSSTTSPARSTSSPKPNTPTESAAVYAAMVPMTSAKALP